MAGPRAGRFLPRKNYPAEEFSGPVMNPLVAAFRSDLRLDADGAEALAAQAHRLLPKLAHSPDDTDEDLVVRLRDPRIFGEFAAVLVDEGALPRATLRAVVEHAFDLLSLPRGEHDAFAVSARAPPRLLALARYLVDVDAFTVLHFLHLVYAVFLDRSLVANVSRKNRFRVLEHIAAQEEFALPLRVLYVCLHLASVPEPEAHAALCRILASDGVRTALHERLAHLASADDGGLAELRRIAEDEGLLTATSKHSADPVVLANVPRLPERLRAPARRWLATSATGWR